MAQESAQPQQPSAPTSGPDRFLLAIVAGTVVLVVVAILAVFLFGRWRTAPPADPDSPAGVVQAYVEAVRGGELERSRTLLTREARTQAEARDRQNAYPSSIPRTDNLRIVVQTVSTTDTHAEVKVTLSRFYSRSDPCSSGTSRYDLTFRLIREDGAWRITQPIEPYSLQ
jgi:hypothetical protein